MRWAMSPSSSVGGPATEKLTTGPKSGSSLADDAATRRARPSAGRRTVGAERSEPLGQRRVRVADRLGVDEVAAHADEPGLVPHDRRGRLEDDRVGQLVGGGHGRVDAGDLDAPATRVMP